MLFIIGAWQDYWLLYHKVTFDGENKLIIPNEGVTEINVEQDIYSDHKEWLKTYDNTKFDIGVRTVAGDPTVGLDSLGATFFLTNGWQIVLNQSILFTGNLFSDDFSSPFIVGENIQLAQQKFSNLVDAPGLDQSGIAPAVWGASAAAYASSTTMGGSIAHILGDVHSSAYEGVVWIDTNNGVAGTAEGVGKRISPSNNFTDATAIATALNITKLQVVENGVILATDDVSGYLIYGSHPLKTEIIVTPGATTTFTQFYDTSLKGTFNGEVLIRNSRVEDLINFEGILHQTLIDGDIQLSVGAKSSHIIECYSGIPGVSTPQLDFNNVNVSMSIRAYSGGIKLVNKDGNASVSIDMNSGQVILDGTITAGTIVSRGVGKLVDNLGNKLSSGSFNGANLVVEMHDSQYAYETWKLLGLDPNDPLVNTPSRRYVQSSSIVQGLTGDPDTSITVTRG